MTPLEFNQFLNTPKTEFSSSVINSPSTAKKSGDLSVILLAGIAIIGVGCAVHFYFENQKLKLKLKERQN
jgi:hypothetical protein